MHHETWTGAHISMFEWGRENNTQNRYSQYWITCFVGRHRRCCFFCGRRLEWCRQFIVKKHNQTDCVERWSQIAAREMSVVRKCVKKEMAENGTWKGTALAPKYTKPHHHKYSCSAQFTILEQQALFRHPTFNVLSSFHVYLPLMF